MARASFWTQLRAILIRNFLLKYHGKRQTIIELVMPLYFIIILIIIRLGVPVTNIPELSAPQTAFSLSNMSQLSGQQVGVVCPNSSTFFNQLNDSLWRVGASAIKFQTENELLQYFELTSDQLSMAVECHQPNGVQNLSYVIRTKPELNLPDLNDLYAKIESCHPPYSDDPTEFYANQMKCNCPARKYYDVGFVQLQTLVDSIFAEDTVDGLNGIDSYLNMNVLLFPKSSFKGNTDYLRSFVPIYMAMAFTPFVAYLCILIVGEKERKIKEAMKLMGLRESVYWLGWLITYGALVLILSLMSSVLLVVAKILPNANLFLMFVLIFLYGLSTITVAFLVTPFFNSAKAAGGFASFSSAVVSCLYYLSVYVNDVPLAVYYIMGLLAPTAFALGMDKAVYLDLTSDGISYSNFWEKGAFGFGSAVVMLVVDTLLYGFLAFYFDNVIPGEYGRKRPPWFIFMPSFWCPKRAKFNRINRCSVGIANQAFVDDNQANPNFERVTEDLIGKEVLRISNIRKVYSSCRKPNVVAVDGISLDMYEGQITAILGHNGAGKTTLLNMLVGLTNPSGGSATMYGLDISDPNNYDQLWELLGICPQHDVLFDILTPRHHLEFFGRVKGVPEKDLNRMVESILQDVDIMDRINAPAGKMSGGQKRKLSIGIALIGDPKVVVLDEPTSGVDPFSRRQLWNLLQKSKAGRLIILTTHFMDEADILADRKAIVSHGKVKCVGSSLFLKNKFGLGYHLTMAMELNYDEQKASELVHSFIPHSEKVRNNATELAFMLPFSQVHKFPSLLSSLDEEVGKNNGGAGPSVGIKSYGMSMTTLEEVFLKLCNNEEEEEEEEARLEENGNVVSRNGRGHKRNPSSSSSLGKKCIIDNIPVKYNWWQAFAIMMKMNILAVVRQPRQICSTVILPILLIIITFYLMTIPTTDKTVNYEVELDFAMYPPYNVLYTDNTGGAIDEFLSELKNEGLTLESYGGTFADLLNSSHIYYLNFTSFDDNQLKVGLEAVYNDTAQHSLPILINFINNAIISMAARLRNASAPIISLFTEPLPRHAQAGDINGTIMAATIIIGFAYNIMTAVYTADSVEDRETKVRHQLQVSGLPFSVYWLSKFCGNYILFCVALVSTLVVVEAFQVQPLVQGTPMCILVVGYMLYMVTALLFGYCFGFLFNKYDTAQSFVGILYMILGFAPYVAVCILDMLAVNNGKTASMLHYIFTACLPLYPPYAILYYLDKVYNTALIKGTIAEPGDYFSNEIIATLIILPVQAVLLCGVLWILDFRSSNGRWSEVFSVILRKKSTISSPTFNTDVPHNEDDDVRNERARVKTLIGLSRDNAPVVAIDCLRKEFVNRKTLSKKKCLKKGQQKQKNIQQKARGHHSDVNDGRKVAVRNLSLAVEKGEVFALLGPNGAGKTSTLRTIVADEVPTRGRVYVAGYDLSKDLKKAIWNMSYCPQHDALWKHVSVKEHLECYAHIRGVKSSMVKSVIKTMMEGLQITEHAGKSTESLSGGTKRKLSYALSMLGDPKVVLLDEPSTGMDPKSKRYLWDTITANFQGSRGAILTTHSMEEADFLSSRVGIMVKGELRCVGSTQHLKNKYGSGYILEAKVLADGDREERFAKLEELIKRIFPAAQLQEKFQDRIRFQVPQTGGLSLAQIFATLEEAKRDVGIEEYSFSQTSLEQLFLDFARKQDFEDSSASLQFRESLKSVS
ncbi:hypothetical protein CHUAL_005851 [Chamberlinius hualienensis]